MNEPATPKLQRPPAPPYQPPRRTLRSWLRGTLLLSLPFLLLCILATTSTINGTACASRQQGYVSYASTLTTHGFPFPLWQDYAAGCYEELQHSYTVNWLGLLGDLAFWLAFGAGAYYFISDLWFKVSYFRIPSTPVTAAITPTVDITSGIIEDEQSAKE